MAYTPTVWKNREVERPRTFQEQNNPDGTVTLIPKEGNVIEAGTPIIADTMNKMELGIKEAHDGLGEIGDVSIELETHMAEDATTTKKGHVQLNSSVTSTSEVLAATPKAVKTAMDRADAAFQSASDGKTVVANAVTAKGVATSPSDTFPTLATKIGQISTGKKFASGSTTASGGFLTIGGLGFKPSVIIMRHSINRTSSFSIYDDSASTTQLFNYQMGTNSYVSIGGYVNDDGFKLTPPHNSALLLWEAFE